MPEFHGKVVIVTGGAQGIGRGICEAFAQTGAMVLCADVNAETGEALVGDKEAAGSGEILFQKADVSLNSDCEALVATAVSNWGGVEAVLRASCQRYRCVAEGRCSGCARLRAIGALLVADGTAEQTPLRQRALARFFQ